MFINYSIVTGFPGDSNGKCNIGDSGSIPWWGDPLEKEMATTPVFLPGEFHGQSYLEGYSPRDHKESILLVDRLTFTSILLLLVYQEP